MLCCLGSFLCGWPGLGVLAAVIWFVVIPKIKERKMKEKLERWNNTPKDVVIMHAIRRARTADLGLKDAWGPKGRFPWISLNGEHMGDSELIIQYLTKKFDVKLGSNYTPKELAVGGAIRIMMDDHFFWGLVLHRFAYSAFSQLEIVMHGVGPSWIRRVFKQYASWAFVKRSKGHGMGLHTREEIVKLTLRDLRYLSDILGNNQFILGSEPCEIDCTVFGHLAQAMWGLPGTPYETAMKGQEFVNLREYCIRMKDRFYPDWNELLKVKKE